MSWSLSELWTLDLKLKLKLTADCRESLRREEEALMSVSGLLVWFLSHLLPKILCAAGDVSLSTLCHKLPVSSSLNASWKRFKDPRMSRRTPGVKAPWDPDQWKLWKDASTQFKETWKLLETLRVTNPENSARNLKTLWEVLESFQGTWSFSNSPETFLFIFKDLQDL